ncbi:Gfo/Idh/MocA family oxidoreductase [Paenibacillus doosanensis]|uniref:Oxidoreductase YdgJ n=1 Tax=Paenibacillus konkukensis TaxID=2020716 RepID=A0ABY4RXJ3_9BACL|nr:MULTISPECIES: Gfo/Idh/MocA family oxidoreductase [Paenibacillus]MCS7458549.1 Gfo/Idh/MocA family oxidoreductase [Paenibacillus doosanensis]UQZ86928.1 putative oxidoreductase YdgJ [Paenibacillus konkukensis]
MQTKDGMNYAPQGKPNPVVGQGEFAFAAMALDHGHIYGMCNGLVEAGADLVAVYDPDPAKVEAFIKKFPQAKAAASEEEILNDPSIKLVAAAAVPSLRGPLGVRVMDHGKDYFTDKTPFTTLEQLEQARAKAKETGKKYMVYYSERLHVESAVFAGQLIEQGAIGRVVQVIGFGPHRLNAPSRPEWFFQHDKYGGILCDIGSHQIEQFLFFTGAKDATVLHSKIANYNNKDYPELEDFGDATLVADNGATNYFRVDWLTPDGLGTWGDGRMTILGTDGYIELRKYIDIARDPQGDHLYLVNKEGEQHFSLKGQVGYPFFGQLILDCINRTEKAMTQEHAFKAAELCIKAQMQAVRVE